MGKQRILSPVLLVLTMLSFGGAACLFVAMGQQEMGTIGDFFGIIAISSMYSFYIVICMGTGLVLMLCAFIAWRVGK